MVLVCACLQGFFTPFVNEVVQALAVSAGVDTSQIILESVTSMPELDNSGVKLSFTVNFM